MVRTTIAGIPGYLAGEIAELGKVVMVSGATAD